MNSSLRNLDHTIKEALNAIIDPLSGKGLCDAGLVNGLSVDEGRRVRFVIEAPFGRAGAYTAIRDQAEAAVRALPGVDALTAVLTEQTGPERTPTTRAGGLPGVKRILAVASAKGGVGKSTLAANLACAFAARGLNTGLLDLDIYGPSLPTLLGIAGRKPALDARKHIIPIRAHKVSAMSIGFVVDAEKPLVWRGAMATQAVRQMLDEVAWDADSGPLDVLVLDLPPGTGDIQLTLAQRLAIDGAIIVSTPQELALADVRRGIAMFEKTHVPILGVVENMAWYETADGRRVAIFGEGGARRTAEAAGLPLLAQLPIEIALRESADAGRPLVDSDPGHPMSARFLALADAAWAHMETAGKPAPIIRFT
jgi:ATP-binding protein involved in chromosome partitioning